VEVVIHYVYNPDFSEISKMSAEEFVSVILKDKLNAHSVSCGRDFHFGKGAACGVEGLSELCRSYGMELLVTDDVCENGKRISSAEIRSLIRAGCISDVNRLLGHDYAVSGDVIGGNKIGRLMNFPTANQKMGEGIVLPKFGVYASYAEIDGRFYKGKRVVVVGGGNSAVSEALYLSGVAE
jgi:riboflavin kinase/FMN adenylyltransferase